MRVVPDLLRGGSFAGTQTGIARFGSDQPLGDAPPRQRRSAVDSPGMG